MAVIYHCPSDKRLLCEWSGHATDIVHHFEDKHRNLLYYTNTVEIDMDLSTDNKLIVLDNNIYLLQIAIVGKLVNFQLRYLGDNQTALKMTYDLIINLQESFYIPQQIDQQWQINLANLQQYHETDTLFCTISIHNAPDCDVVDLNRSPKSDSDDVDDVETKYVEALRFVQNKIQRLHQQKSDVFDNVSQLNWSMLEEPLKMPTISRQNSLQIADDDDYSDGELHYCYVCRKDMLPPIYLCTNGHNVCVNCHQSLCLCGGQVTNIRNVEEENYSRTHQHPCRYATNGCMERLYYNELRTHETKCYYCKYKCLISGCTFEDKYQLFIQHLRIHHSSVRIVATSAVCDFPKDSEFFIVHRDRGVFYCRSETVDDQLRWSAMFCGPKDRRFFCELQFKGGRLNDPLFLKNDNDRNYVLCKTKLELKKMKVKEKNAVLTITSFD